MLHCIFLLSDVGEVMLEKQWMGQQVDRSICSWFWTQAHPPGEDYFAPLRVTSVIASPTYYLVNIVREGVTFLGCTQSEMEPLLGIEFLCRVADVLADYFGGINEDIIKDNYVVVYQLLDEMMDCGFPLTTEPRKLKEMITPPNLVSRVLSVVTGGSSSMISTLPTAGSSNVPWRASGIKHLNNEISFDLVEEMDAIVNKDGFLVKCQVYGEVHGNSRLSGMPELFLTFMSPSIVGDVRFHPCISYHDWEARQQLKFIPPDGRFKLMSYRVKGLDNTPLYVKPQLSCSEGVVRVNVLVGIRVDPGRTVESISVDIPWPPSVTVAELTANYGTVLFNNSTKVCNWNIGEILKDKNPCLTGTVKLKAGLDRLHEFPTMVVGFKITGVALSGLKVDKLDFANVTYRPHKHFRAMTKTRSYDIRC